MLLQRKKENPFRRDGSCGSLPLNSLCSMIAANLAQRRLDISCVQASLDSTRWD